jgi:hypothetical protein
MVTGHHGFEFRKGPTLTGLQADASNYADDSSYDLLRMTDPNISGEEIRITIQPLKEKYSTYLQLPREERLKERAYWRKVIVGIVTLGDQEKRRKYDMY